MPRSPEEFARGLGYKISKIRMGFNKFRNNCVDCGTNVYRSEGWMVKGDEHDKVQTVCRVCGDKWLDKESLESPWTMRSIEERHRDWQGGGYKTWSGEKYE